MPRGRAGLDLIAPSRVAEAFKKWGGWRAGPTETARRWNVNERTVRRWMATGLPLCYGGVWITREEWIAFEKTGAVPPSRVKAEPITRAPSKKKPRRPAFADELVPRYVVPRRTRLDRRVSARSRGQVRP